MIKTFFKIEILILHILMNKIFSIFTYILYSKKLILEKCDNFIILQFV